MLTEAENTVLNKIGEAWAAFVALPRCHPMELQEGCTFIHGLQSLVMVRSAVRSDPERFTHLPEFRLTIEAGCLHEFGALGAVSEGYCIHCGADSKAGRNE